MDPQSDKHNPRVDEEMKHDVESLLKGAPVESRAQESRLQEDPGVGPGTRRDVPESSGAGIPTDAADLRADIARHLASVRFPATGDDLVAAAEADSASAEVLRLLRGLPPGQPYPNVQAVWAAVGGETESPHTH